MGNIISAFISPNTLLIECIINPSGGTTQQKNPFGTIMQLQNRKVIAIETVSDQDTTYSPISTGNQVIPQSVFLASFLTLYTASVFDTNNKVIRPEGLYYDQIPLPIIRRIHNYDVTTSAVTSGGNDLFRMRPTEISWTKSYVTVPHSVSIGSQYSALFLVHYLDEGDPGLNYIQ